MTVRAVRRVGVVSLVALFVAGAAWALAPSLRALGPSCQPVADDQEILESSAFTPVEAQRSLPIDIPILSGEPASVDVPPSAAVPGGSIDGLPVRHVIASPNGAVYQYFLAAPLSDEMAPNGFLAAGGIEFQRDPIERGNPFAEYVLSQLADRAVAIRIGDFKAALAWGDPRENGVRPHGLYWSDSEYNYSLIADRSAEALVNLGRSLACS